MEGPRAPVPAPKPAPAPATKLALWRRALALIGITTTPGQRWHAQLTRRFFVLVGIGALLGVSAFASLTVYSTSPSFCHSCHIMDPYYDAWASSKHNHVACVDCHYPPATAKTLLWKKFQAVSQVVAYVTQTYASKPYADVEDESCLRSGCHSTSGLSKHLVSKRGVHFDHEKHLGKLEHGPEKIRCVSCHTQTTVDEHIQVDWKVCHLCHFKGRGSGRELDPVGGCEKCHTLPTREITVGNVKYQHDKFLAEHKVKCMTCHMDAVQPVSKVPDDRCRACHNTKEKLEKYADRKFVHDAHVAEHNLSCFQCHSDVHHGKSKAGAKDLTLSCGVCHLEPHDVPRQLYRGVGARGVAEMPSPMYVSNVDCMACHLEKGHNGNGASHAETFRGTEKGCIDCHGKEYVGVLAETLALLKETHDKLGEKLAKLRQDVAREGAAPLSETAKNSLDDASHNLDFVAAGRGIHNPYYAAQVLRITDGKLDTVAAERNVKVDDTSGLPMISGSFCAVLCHSKVGVKVPAEKVKYKEKLEVPHTAHIENGMACTVCHVFGGHKDVKPNPNVNCLECHEPAELEPK